MSLGPFSFHGYQGPTGYLLPQPVLEKHTAIDLNESVLVAMSSMQGWRQTMEDVSVVLLRIPGDRTDTMYFSVFDGHGGTRVAKYAGANLHKHIMKQREWDKNIREAIYKGYKECDAFMRLDKQITNEMSGTTALTIYIRDNYLVCANVGDSRAVACAAGRVVRLSYDHKPSLPTERSRILAAGGFVEADRVQGNLALSRALGDYQYKIPNFSPEFQPQNPLKQYAAATCESEVAPKLKMVSPVPDIILKQLDRTWEFVVMACDGIWEVMTNEMVVQFVRSRLIDRIPLQNIAEALITSCLSPKCTGMSVGCDNMSVIIIQFRWTRSDTGAARQPTPQNQQQVKTKTRKSNK